MGVTIAVMLATPASATFPGRNGRIAYDAYGSLYTIRPDGTGDRRVFRQSLTDPEFVLGAAHRPQWSASGRRLLFEREYGDGGLWYAHASGAHRRLIWRPRGQQYRGHDLLSASAPSWAPNGRRVAFSSGWEIPSDDPVDEKFRSAIFTVDLVGSRLRMLRLNGHSPTWSPDGRTIAFTLGEEGRRVAAMDPKGGRFRVLLEIPEGSGVGDLEFSPDGRELLFEQYGFEQLGPAWRSLDLKTRDVRTILPSREHWSANDATWSPDARQIAYLELRRDWPGPTPPTRVFAIDPDGGDSRMLFTLPYDDRNGRWAETLSWQPRR